MTNELIGIIGIIVTMLGGFLAFGISFGGLKKAVDGLESKFQSMTEDVRDLRNDFTGLRGEFVDFSRRLGVVEELLLSSVILH
jgi:hypothetical protein